MWRGWRRGINELVIKGDRIERNVNAYRIKIRLERERSVYLSVGKGIEKYKRNEITIYKMKEKTIVEAGEKRVRERIRKLKGK